MHRKKEESIALTWVWDSEVKEITYEEFPFENINNLTRGIGLEISTATLAKNTKLERVGMNYKDIDVFASALYFSFFSMSLFIGDVLIFFLLTILQGLMRFTLMVIKF